MQILLTELQQDLVDTLSSFANVIVLLGKDPTDHMFFTYTSFDGVNRSNIGSVEHNTFKGINITKFLKTNMGLNTTAPATLLSNYHKFIETKEPQTVKYPSNMLYLIFGNG